MRKEFIFSKRVGVSRDHCCTLTLARWKYTEIFGRINSVLVIVFAGKNIGSVIDRNTLVGFLWPTYHQHVHSGRGDSMATGTAQSKLQYDQFSTCFYVSARQKSVQHDLDVFLFHVMCL